MSKNQPATSENNQIIVLRARSRYRCAIPSDSEFFLSLRRGLGEHQRNTRRFRLICVRVRRTSAAIRLHRQRSLFRIKCRKAENQSGSAIGLMGGTHHVPRPLRAPLASRLTLRDPSRPREPGHPLSPSVATLRRAFPRRTSRYL